MESYQTKPTFPFRTQQQPSADEGTALSLSVLIDALRREWPLVVGTFLTVMLLVALYTFSVQPIYQAQSVVLVDVDGTSPAEIRNVLSFADDNRGLLNEVEILRQSVPLAERVATRLLESRVSTSDTGAVMMLQREGAARLLGEQLLGLVSFSIVNPNVDMIRITALSPKPEEAALMSNLYAEEYARRSRDNSRASISASEAFLAELERKKQDELDAAEQELEVYMRREDAIGLDNQSSSVVSQIATLDAAYEEARLELDMERASLESLEQEIERIEPNLSTRIASSVDKEIEGLTQTIAALEIQADNWFAENPELRGNEAAYPRDLQRIFSQIGQYRTELVQLSDQLVREVEAVGGADPNADGLSYVARLRGQIAEKRIRIRGLEAKLQTTTQRINRYEQRLARIPGQTMRLVQLERRQQTAEQMYLLVNQKLEEARIAQEAQLGYVELIREARLPGAPVHPNKPQNFILGALLGLLLGIGMAFIRRASVRTIEKPDDLREHGHNVLGVVPDLSASARAFAEQQNQADNRLSPLHPQLVTVHDPVSVEAEAYRHLRTHVQFSLPDRVIQALLVTSPGPGEGKSVTAMNLAVTMVQAGRKTVVVDLDLRRPSAHTLVGVEVEPGVADLLFARDQVDWETFRTPIEDLYVIPAGKHMPNPAEMVGSKRMRMLIQQLRAIFDTIIIDSPPVNLVTDATLAATQCDATMLIVSASDTHQMALRRATETLGSVGTVVIGTVLNRYDTRFKEDYGYGYGYDSAYYGPRDKEPVRNNKAWWDPAVRILERFRSSQ